MDRSNLLKDTLELYDYNLPFAVAMYLCQVCRPHIVCGVPVTYKLFIPFVEIRKDVKYVFAKVVDSNEKDFRVSKLEKIDVLIPLGKEVEMADKLGTMFEWYGDGKLSEYERKNYAGKCMIRLS